ncbi:hypothetical protein HMPREF9103_00010 [Lentilactobacillus parafarraginis F0439]|uniref:Uncharacterized protein n=1 Tax=Lentilactobacillus parafarraginis F0439 TaxID=797515 RepID=G9ZJW4_9LACO|nr:hypothetical protein HMPREF9103_00010 [Lentilactobacillus parafarraginis F0439]
MKMITNLSIGPVQYQITSLVYASILASSMVWRLGFVILI